MINDAILFQQYNALNGATVAQALAGGIIHSNRMAITSIQRGQLSFTDSSRKAPIG
jgi:hypothetical protein